MIKLKHKQTDKEWLYSATVWFEKKYDISNYEILEWNDVVELFDKQKNSLGKFEKRDAVKQIDDAPYLELYFKEVENPNKIKSYSIDEYKIIILEKLKELGGLDPNNLGIDGLQRADGFDICILLSKSGFVDLTKQSVEINIHGKYFLEKSISPVKKIIHEISLNDLTIINAHRANQLIDAGLIAEPLPIHESKSKEIIQPQIINNQVKIEFKKKSLNAIINISKNDYFKFIVTGLIVGLAVAYFVFIFKWNK